MKKCRITALRKTEYPDLMEQYENPLETPCTVSIGQVWVTNGWEKPADFCESAWNTLSPFVMALAHGGENFYDGWMKNFVLTFGKSAALIPTPLSEIRT